MPGWVGHTIILHKDLDALENSAKLSFTGFSELTEIIQSEINDIYTRVNTASTGILSDLASTSQTLQRESITKYNSIVTGALLRSISVFVSRDQARIGTNLHYASYVELGRGPVYPKNAKVLHFITKNGDEVFAKSVGPADPRPYNTDSSNALTGEIDKCLDEVFKGL